MIKLKDLLMEIDGTFWIGNETYPAHTRTALHWMRQKYIPLSPKVVEKIVGKKIPVKSFHITGPESLHRMKNVLTSKKSLSTFTMTNKDEKLAKGGGIQTKGGIILLDDDGSAAVVHPRWAKVYAIGKDQNDVKVGEWVMVAHGRWSRALKVKKDGEELEVRMIDENDILLTSDDEPEQNRKKAGYVNTGGQKQMTSLPGNE